ncbi:MAG: penicillin-binding protein 2 [Candidatus Zixiibacteriota bacterium]
MDRLELSMSGRERTAIVVIILMFLFLFAGLLRFQVFQHQQLADQSEKNRVRLLPIVTRRGTFYDREGRVLVDTRTSYTVSVLPSEEVRNLTVPNLAGLLQIDTVEIRKRIVKNTVNRYQPAAVKRGTPFEIVAVLEEQHDRFPGVTIQMERVRNYADSTGAECATGHVSEVSRDELEQYRSSDLRPGSIIGKKGLEKAFDPQLRGLDGTEYIEVFASGQVVGPYEGLARKNPVPGADLHLTLDLDLQRASLLALDSFCCGAVVAIDPRNGEILAMVSYPSWNANLFSGPISDSLWQAMSTDSSHPLLNRPLTGQYPPGSTLKLITVGAGLEEKLITPTSTFRGCTGGYRFGNRIFHCWDERGHGVLAAAHAIEQSCDIYMYQLGLKLGVDLLSKYYDECGFGKPTGIEIPGEVRGNNPNSAYYDRIYGKRGWTQGLVLNNSIGQGEILVTPLQLAQFYCGIANSGTVYRPHMVRSVVWPDGRRQVMSPRRSFALPFSPETMAVLREGARLVVQGDRGTARSLRRKGYTIAGKTGTAQNPHGRDHSLFVGFAPFEAPEIVVCAIIENAGHGSEVAAPVVAKVIDAYMAKKQPPDQIAAVAPEAKR